MAASRYESVFLDASGPLAWFEPDVDWLTISLNAVKDKVRAAVLTGVSETVADVTPPWLGPGASSFFRWASPSVAVHPERGAALVKWLKDTRARILFVTRHSVENLDCLCVCESKHYESDLCAGRRAERFRESLKDFLKAQELVGTGASLLRDAVERSSQVNMGPLLRRPVGMYSALALSAALSGSPIHAAPRHLFCDSTFGLMIVGGANSKFPPWRKCDWNYSLDQLRKAASRVGNEKELSGELDTMIDAKINEKKRNKKDPNDVFTLVEEVRFSHTNGGKIKVLVPLKVERLGVVKPVIAYFALAAACALALSYEPVQALIAKTVHRLRGHL
mmetsp:Transcript_71880/g.191866  ORF Transcript_71880/g.191866 Transcript_71880/m.191866 type:complete len:334 (+) Transcript_71880:2115-3116(+)